MKAMAIDPLKELGWGKAISRLAFEDLGDYGVQVEGDSLALGSIFLQCFRERKVTYNKRVSQV